MSIFIYNSLPLVMAHGICAIANVMKTLFSKIEVSKGKMVE